VRPRRRLLLALLPLALAVSSTSHAQDFDPRGRHHGPPAGRPGGGGHAPAGGAHGGARPPAGAGEAGGPSAAVLIERYTRVALSQAGAAFPLQRLAQLYRDRDGNIAKLITDFEGRAAQTGADQYPATITLAGLYKIDGRTDDSIKTYEKAIALKGSDPTALLALAHLFQDRGDLAEARTRYEKALPLLTVQADKEQTIRAVMSLALDQKDWAAAKAAHKQLVALEPTSLFVKGELGRELYNRGEYTQAEVELKDVVAAATGDNRALAPALKELGRDQAKAHENVEALATLKRALATAGEQSALRAEIYAIVTEIYRADQ
jgi:cellulose synthase operon protein C